ncbi:uncharacterized protein KY384_007979 [Bacidia gigantensis]|uniref:uncharacterized protein n=1 Tax=Bacidia gigantensis TaxID=2732470 RepID=UPI001D05730D|nr:uncharacterized protein KY384_007979 [Bacidia gigantensis]KAG8527825.1 hypothetical protein KY384_007979 [Bacidia gigantensis]
MDFKTNVFTSDFAEAPERQPEVPLEEKPIPVRKLSIRFERKMSLLSICGITLTTGESWVALGSGIVVSIYNLGPPGVIFGLVAASFFYWFIAASIAELASALPSSGTVYHWASITGGRKYGRVCGWFAGWWNFLAWLTATVSLGFFMALQTVAMYSTVHPEYEQQNWHVFISFLLCSVVCSLVVLFGDKYLHYIENFGAFASGFGFLITVLVCAIMPTQKDTGYASNSQVWVETQNETGYDPLSLPPPARAP